ncbi:hypothetical protein SLEP1_g41268 [Rubroshorea leprosula]|uniref:Uncharacterized protein n=1 Tax=Rubroshorea leprosula TaxID=152421 RepID=A0AAV5L653_9ROSI|nr:hypothetical protein SLEP1_g41268 [Rubroshorea leprosula]
MKRQSSSSSRTENAPENLHAKTIGCMSSIFHLLYKYRNRKKFLTSGKKQEAERERDSSTKIQLKGTGNGLIRSPMLPADIRTPPHTVVARLMGVEYETESAVETRRKLVGALERCDEELKAVKRIIEVVKRSVTAEGNNEIADSKSSEVADFNISSAIDIYNSTASKFGGPTVQQQQKQQLRKPGREEVVNTCWFDRFRRDWVHAGENVVRRKAMVDSVNEVCSDIEWGERREFGRIGLALHDHICRDLIEETVKEMGYHSIPSLPFEACKRRLCF